MLNSVLNDLNADSNAHPVNFSNFRPLIAMLSRAGRHLFRKTVDHRHGSIACVAGRIYRDFDNHQVGIDSAEQSIMREPQNQNGGIEGWIFKCLGPI